MSRQGGAEVLEGFEEVESWEGLGFRGFRGFRVKGFRA